VSPHDHGGSRGAFTVLSGQLTERRWQGGVPADRVVGAGEVVTVGSSVVHDVFCVGAGPAVSVHAYSPPLSSMGFYDESGTTLLDRQLVGTEAGPSATARALHPAGGR
jgi:hypothetical protein